MSAASAWHFPQSSGISVPAGLPRNPFRRSCAFSWSSCGASPPWQDAQVKAGLDVDVIRGRPGGRREPRVVEHEVALDASVAEGGAVSGEEPRTGGAVPQRKGQRRRRAQRASCFMASPRAEGAAKARSGPPRRAARGSPPTFQILARRRREISDRAAGTIVTHQSEPAESENADRLARHAGDLGGEVLERLEHPEEVPLGPDAGRAPERRDPP